MFGLASVALIFKNKKLNAHCSLLWNSFFNIIQELKIKVWIMKSQPGFAKIICLDGRITGVLARGKSGQLSEFQKTFVKGSHAMLIENREIWSKSVFSKIH